MQVLVALLLVLREGFEATLLVAIILACLTKTGRSGSFTSVWYGIGATTALSVVAGALMFITASSLSGDAGEIFKGVTMWFAVGLLTCMVLWMLRQARTIVSDIRRGVDETIGKGGALALAILAFVMVFREGLETALFMFSIAQVSSPLQVTLGSGTRSARCSTRRLHATCSVSKTARITWISGTKKRWCGTCG